MFLDLQEYGFVDILRDAWTDIRDECLALPTDSFVPWVQREMYGEGWSVYGLVAFGTRIEPALAACPRTAAAIEAIPGLTTAGFSRLAPDTHIKPHEGWVTTVYRGHLGLLVPDGCGLRVGSPLGNGYRARYSSSTTRLITRRGTAHRVHASSCCSTSCAPASMTKTHHHRRSRSSSADGQ